MRAAFVLLLLTGAPDDAAEPTALLEGNRLFLEDKVDQALEIYEEGWTGDGSPGDAALAYNAGTSALRLGRLPEAVLWLRRAEAAVPGDPWVRNNLDAVRDALGQPAPESPLLVAAARYGPWVALGGTVAAWALFALLALGRPIRPGWLAALAALSCVVFAAGFLAERLSPRAAVLLAPCPGLPAGSEIWLRPGEEEDWKIHGQKDLRCSERAIGWVRP